MQSSLIIQSALMVLRTGLSKDKADRFAFVVSQSAQVVAVALAKTPPKGVGNPADWKELSATFAAVGMDNYAKHCAGIKAAITDAGTRSCATWAEACVMGETIVSQAFAPLSPRTLTPEQVTARLAKREQRATDKAKQDKADAKTVSDVRRAELAAEYARGLADGIAQAGTVTAGNVADMIRSGAFDTAGLIIIMDAMPATQTA